MGNCSFCGKNAGFLRNKHKECQEANDAGKREMAALAAQAAAVPDFNEAALRISLSAVAKRSGIGEDGIRSAIIAQGWQDAVGVSLADGILTQDEKSRLRAFRDRLAVGSDGSTANALAQLDRAVQDRLMLDARLAALTVEDAEFHLRGLDAALRDSGMSPQGQRRLLVTAWEAAVEGALEDGALEDGVPSLDEEASLTRYLQRFNLNAGDVNANGAHRSLVEAAVIREAAEGIVPTRFRAGADLTRRCGTSVF